MKLGGEEEEEDLRSHPTENRKKTDEKGLSAQLESRLDSD